MYKTIVVSALLCGAVCFVGAADTPVAGHDAHIEAQFGTGWQDKTVAEGLSLDKATASPREIAIVEASKRAACVSLGDMLFVSMLDVLRDSVNEEAKKLMAGIGDVDASRSNILAGVAHRKLGSLVGDLRDVLFAQNVTLWKESANNFLFVLFEGFPQLFVLLRDEDVSYLLKTMKPTQVELESLAGFITKYPGKFMGLVFDDLFDRLEQEKNRRGALWKYADSKVKSVINLIAKKCPDVLTDARRRRFAAIFTSISRGAGGLGVGASVE